MPAHLLVYHPGKRSLIIHDRGEQQKGAPIDGVVREAQGRLALKAQPAYSPELNPKSASGNGCATSSTI